MTPGQTEYEKKPLVRRQDVDLRAGPADLRAPTISLTLFRVLTIAENPKKKT